MSAVAGYEPRHEARNPQMPTASPTGLGLPKPVEACGLVGMSWPSPCRYRNGDGLLNAGLAY